MNLLLLDTSTKNLSLAVARAGRVVCYRNLKLDRVLSTSIIPAIRAILRRAGLAVADLEGLAVGLGPGSFTSLRVGLATAKGLSFGRDIPLVGVSSLDVLAMNALRPGVARIAVLTDARRDMVYSCLYEAGPTGLIRSGAYSLGPVDAVLSRVGPDTVLIGDGLAVFRDAVARHLRSVGAPVKNLCPQRDWLPQARRMLPLVADRFARRDYDDRDRLVPLYLYKEDCQVRRA